MIDVHKLQDAIDKWCLTQPEERYEVHIPEEKGGPRKYLGLSALGDPCARKVWFGWRWCAPEKFSARMLRLFRRGHREEQAFIVMLRGVGMQVHTHDEDGKQFKITDFDGHLSGHMDGVGFSKEFWKGPNPKPFLLEFKTYNAKRFVKVQKEGVASADPKYYVQMQMYSGYEDLVGALFCAVCKDDDALYFDWVPAKRSAFNSGLKRAESIIAALSPKDVPRVSDTPSWYECKYCHLRDICHKDGKSVVSCRSCCYGIPSDGGAWICHKGKEFGAVCKEYKDIARV